MITLLMRPNGTLRQLVGRPLDAGELREAVELGHPVIRFSENRFQTAVIDLQGGNVTWVDIEVVT